MPAPRHLEASGKQYEVRQEELFNDDGIKVGLSFIDNGLSETSARCISRRPDGEVQG